LRQLLGLLGQLLCLLSGLRLLSRLLTQVMRPLDGLSADLLRLLDGLGADLLRHGGATAYLLSFVPGTTVAAT
jgi:hypothetical protein